MKEIDKKEVLYTEEEVVQLLHKRTCEVFEFVGFSFKPQISAIKIWFNNNKKK